MNAGFRLWQRDIDVIHEAARSARTTWHIMRQHAFPSRKKTAERLVLYYRAGLLKRIAYYHPCMQGKPEFVYYTGIAPHPRTLSHTLAVAEVCVQTAEWVRNATDYSADFYFSHELATSGGVIPDATLLVHRGTQTALVFFEIDLGTEPVTSNAGYSLAGKLRSYANYFDSGAYANDVQFAANVQGFRVALVVPSARLRQVEHVVAHDHHDFVLVTTADRFAQGFHHAIWLTHDAKTVDVLGRPAPLVTRVVG